MFTFRFTIIGCPGVIFSVMLTTGYTLTKYLSSSLDKLCVTLVVIDSYSLLLVTISSFICFTLDLSLQTSAEHFCDSDLELVNFTLFDHMRNLTDYHREHHSVLSALIMTFSCKYSLLLKNFQSSHRPIAQRHPLGTI